MKKIILFLILFMMPIVMAQEINQFVNDYSNILNPNEIIQINQILQKIYDSGQAEYAIIIIDSLEGQDIEGYSYQLAQENIGNTDKNNGILLLIAINDRKYRFEVGRGLEPILPDIIMGRIGRTYLEPNFISKDYGKGIIEASISIGDTLSQNLESEFYRDEKQNDSVSKMIFFIIIMIFIFFIWHSWFLGLKTNSKSHKKRKKDDDYFTAAYLLGSMIRGGRRGGGNFGGSNLGGGSFGGGSFGGGGASGGW
jgi:uncharacterized protein